MSLENTVIRFKMETGHSDQEPVFHLSAAVEEGAESLWTCHLNIKQAQSRMEVGVEVTPSKTNKTSSAPRIPLFFYDIYQSRAQAPRRNESPNSLRVELMVLSRTSFPYSTFHNLGRVSLTQDGMADWITKTVSDHLQKILKGGFETSSASAPRVAGAAVKTQPLRL